MNNPIDFGRLSMLAMARHLCERHDVDFDEILHWNERFGYIVSTPSSLAIGSLESVGGDMAFFVELLIGRECIPMMLHALPVFPKKIKFARRLGSLVKPKIYDTERFCRLFGVDPKPLKLFKTQSDDASISKTGS